MHHLTLASRFMIAATVLVLGLNVVAAEPKLPSPRPLGATYKKSLDTAAKNFEAEREAAKYKYLEEIQNVLTKAMQEGDLDAANQINELNWTAPGLTDASGVKL